MRAKMELIDRHALLKKVYGHPHEREWMTDGEWCRKCIYEAPKVEAEPVRRREGCSYCKGRSYSKKPLTVITRTMKRVEVVFEYCPACGRKMDLRTPTEVQLDEADSVMRGADND